MVVALRGTQSIADLVTDAVVHPEPMEDWIPTVSLCACAAVLLLGRPFKILRGHSSRASIFFFGQQLLGGSIAG